MIQGNKNSMDRQSVGGQWVILDIDEDRPFDGSGNVQGVIYAVVLPPLLRYVECYRSRAAAEQAAIDRWGANALERYAAVFLDATNYERCMACLGSESVGAVEYRTEANGADTERVTPFLPVPLDSIFPERFRSVWPLNYPIALNVARRHIPNTGIYEEWVVPDPKWTGIRESVVMAALSTIEYCKVHYASESMADPVASETRLLQVRVALSEERLEVERMSLEALLHPVREEAFTIVRPPLSSILAAAKSDSLPANDHDDFFRNQSFRLNLLSDGFLKDTKGRTLNLEDVLRLPECVKSLLGDVLAGLIMAGGWPTVYATKA